MWWWTVFLFGWVICVAWCIQLLPIFYAAGYRTLRRFSNGIAEPEEWPLLTVLVPARDEGPHIAAGLKSLLASDYPRLEVIAIDDRSRDDTGRVMDELAASDPRLKVIHVTELPEGFKAALPAYKVVERPVLALTAGDGDRTFEAHFGDVLDDPFEHLFVAKAWVDDSDPVNRDHLDALRGERHGYAACRNGTRSAKAKKPSSVSKRKASSERPL